MFQVTAGEEWPKIMRDSMVLNHLQFFHMKIMFSMTNENSDQ